jgi:hypothetical protein
MRTNKMAAIGPPVSGVPTDEYRTASRTTPKPVLHLDEEGSLSQPRECRSLGRWE